MKQQRQRTGIKIAVSSCLLGQAVRYDGGHRHCEYVTRQLARYFELIPYCPEVAIGLGVPRPTIQLVDQAGGIRVLGVEDISMDVTERLHDYGLQVATELENVSGYIFKKNSPSCGTKNVPVFSADGVMEEKGTGYYAATIMQQHPQLPVIDEQEFMVPEIRKVFIKRVFDYYRAR